MFSIISQTFVVEHDEKSGEQPKVGEDSLAKTELKTDGENTKDVESGSKTPSYDEMLTSPKSSADNQTLTSPKLPPLIPDGEKFTLKKE